MSGYGDAANYARAERFLERWAPGGSWEHLEVTPENLRHNIARARSAQAELREIKDALRVLKERVDHAA